MVIKLNSKVAKELITLENFFTFDKKRSKKESIESIVEWHVNGYIKHEFPNLNELSLMDLMEALVNGYEIEETSQEKLLKLYKDYTYRMKTSEMAEVLNYYQGILKGIELTLEIKGEKIKGINE